MTPTTGYSPGPQDDPLPQWGRMRPPGHHPPEPARSDAAEDPHELQRTIAARRRATRGLSFALIMLGVLMGFGLAALNQALWAIAAVIPAVIGLSGFIAVHLGVPSGLRLPKNTGPSPGRSWWLAPAGLLVLGIGSLGAAFTTDAGSPETGSPWTIVWLVTAATLLTAATLGFGLVAASRLSVPDDDDAPLRHVDWSREYPHRFDDQPRRPGRHYDSSWITGNPRSSHSDRNRPSGEPRDR